MVCIEQQRGLIYTHAQQPSLMSTWCFPDLGNETRTILCNLRSIRLLVIYRSTMSWRQCQFDYFISLSESLKAVSIPQLLQINKYRTIFTTTAIPSDSYNHRCKQYTTHLIVIIFPNECCTVAVVFYTVTSLYLRILLCVPPEHASQWLHYVYKNDLLNV